MFFGRTELIIGASKAKNCEESASDVRFHVAPPKPAKKSEKRNFETEFFRRKFFFGDKIWSRNFVFSRFWTGFGGTT